MVIPPNAIDLEIGQLVLHGVAHDQRHRIRAAVERHLDAMLTAGRRHGRVPTADTALEVASVTVQGGGGPDAIGREIAAAMMQKLGGQTCR